MKEGDRMNGSLKTNEETDELLLLQKKVIATAAADGSIVCIGPLFFLRHFSWYKFPVKFYMTSFFIVNYPVWL